MEYFDLENIEDAIDVLNDQAARIKNPTYSYLKEAYEMGARALNIIKTIYMQHLNEIEETLIRKGDSDNG